MARCPSGCEANCLCDCQQPWPEVYNERPSHCRDVADGPIWHPEHPILVAPEVLQLTQKPRRKLSTLPWQEDRLEQGLSARCHCARAVCCGCETSRGRCLSLPCATGSPDCQAFDAFRSTQASGSGCSWVHRVRYMLNIIWGNLFAQGNIDSTSLTDDIYRDHACKTLV